MTLEELREEIESVDLEIIRLIRARMDVALKIAEEKSSTGIPTRVPDRVEAVLTHVTKEAERSGIDPDPVRKIFTMLIRMSEELQDKKRGTQ